MKASFIIFVLIQITAECRSASVSKIGNKSEVIWATDELPSEEMINSEPIQKEAALEEILRTLEEIEEIVLGEASSNDSNVQSDDPHDDNLNRNQNDRENRHNRIRAFRVEQIEWFILNFTGHLPPDGTNMWSNNTKKENNITTELINKIFTKAENVSYPTFTRTIPALCNQTNTTKENVINLHFNLKDTKSSSSREVINVTSAWFRIYKFSPKEINTTTLLEPINFTLMYNNNKTTSKKKHKKTIKLNPQYLQMDEERWIEWDVKEVVSVWLNELNTTSKNFGKIRIKVADNQDHALPVHEFFNMKNCSKITELPVMLPFDDRNSNYVMFPHLNFTIQVIPRIQELRKKLVENTVNKNQLQDQENSKGTRANENQNTFNEPFGFK